jgi:hypothetical protein
VRLKVTDKRRFRRTMTAIGFIPFTIVAARVWVQDRAFVLDLESMAVGISLTIAIGLFATYNDKENNDD